MFRDDLITIVLNGAGHSAFKPLEDRFFGEANLPNVICQWCSCHSLNLLMESLVDISGIDILVNECRDYFKFVRNYDMPRTFLRDSSGKWLVIWAETRIFA